MKKNTKFVVVYTIVISLLVIVVGGFFALEAKSNKSKVDSVGVIKENEFYTLRSNATEYQKLLYKELTDGLKEGNDAVNAEHISKNFIADFYTWTNKKLINDVGGLQYIQKDMVANVSYQAQDGLYNDVAYYISKDQIKDTLEITDVKTSVQKVEFIRTIDKEKVSMDAFEVLTSWTFKDSSLLNVDEYQQEARITVIKEENGLYSIVEIADEN